LKTKVVIFRNRGNIKSEEKWYLNGESIEICNEFMYLGILLNYNGVFTNAQKMLSNQGEKLAVFSLFSKIQDDYFNTAPLRYHFSSDLILPRFLKMTTFVFNKFTCRLYSFEHTFTTLIIF
jgi:hypothetical protein